jgi:CubicO group peptidase (beta-lactamase class C family)
MKLRARIAGIGRRAAYRVGLVRDRTRSVAAAVEALIEARAQRAAEGARVRGLSVAVRFAEGRTILRAVGEAAAGRPTETSTVFPVGSISKTVTAVVAMSLVERGLLALDEPVWRRIGSWRPAIAEAHPEAITLRRLLSHSAGLDHVLYGRTEPGTPPRARELLSAAEADGRALRVVAAPGSAFRYSSAGYGLTQLLIEETTGQRFADVARDRVLLPLGMSASGYVRPTDPVAGFATGHAADGAPLPPTTWRSPADAGLLTTAEDVARLWTSLVPGGRGEPAGRGVLSPASCAAMLTPQVDLPQGGGWGLGLRLRPEAADLRYQHGGRHAGCFCHAQGFARRRAAVVVLSNADGGADAVLTLCREVRHALHRLAY